MQDRTSPFKAGNFGRYVALVTVVTFAATVFSPSSAIFAKTPHSNVPGDA